MANEDQTHANTLGESLRGRGGAARRGTVRHCEPRQAVDPLGGGGRARARCACATSTHPCVPGRLAPRPPDRPTRRGCVAAHLAQHLGAQGGARLIEEQHTSRGAAPRYLARRMADISLAAFEALSVHRLLDSNSDTDETPDTTLRIQCAMRHRAHPRGLRLVMQMRSASDAKPRIRMSIAGPMRPPVPPKPNTLAQVIAISVDSRPSPDSHPSVSGGSSDALTVGPPGRARVVRAPHRWSWYGGVLVTQLVPTSGIASTEPRLGPTPQRGHLTVSSMPPTTANCTPVTIVNGSLLGAGQRVRSAG